MLSNIIVGNYGTIQIADDALIDFRITYSARLAKIKTTYQNPIIQYLGKNPSTLNLKFKTMSIDEVQYVWSVKHNLTGSTYNITMFGVNYGDWYLVDTKIEFETTTYLMTDDGLLTYYPSHNVISVIEVMAVK